MTNVLTRDEKQKLIFVEIPEKDRSVIISELTTVMFQNRRDNTLSHCGRSTTTVKVLWCTTWCTPEKNQVRLVCKFNTVR